MSILASNFNSKLKEANLHRKEDAATTKRELAKMEERVSQQISGVTQTLANHESGLKLLHEGQMHLEINLKMLMNKMGVTPSNSLPSHASNQEPPSDLHKNTEEAQLAPMGGRELDGDFKMTEEEFDSVLEDYSRARNTLIEKKQKVSPPSDLEGGDPYL